MATRGSRGVVGISAVALLLPGLAAAQAGQSPTTQASKDANSGGALQEVVVTAQRREQSQQDVPISLSALTEAVIDQANLNTTMDLPRLAPSLTFSQGYFPGATSFNIRGIGSYVYRIGVQPAVSAVIDGVPLARNGDFVADLGDLERVEVLNGPQGTLFGRNTTGGVINMVRKRPAREYEAALEGRLTHGRLGDDGSLMRGSFNAPLGEQAAARVFAFRRENDHYIENLHVTAPDEGALRSTGVSAMLDVDFGDSVNVLLSADHAESRVDAGEPQVLIPLQSYQAPTIPDVAEFQTAMQAGAVGERFNVNQWNPWYTTQELSAATADITWDISDRLRLKSLTSYRTNDIGSTPNFYPVSASVLDTQGWDWLSGTMSSLNRNKTPRRTEYEYVTHESRIELSGDAFELTAGVYYLDLAEKETAELPRYRSARSLGPTFVARVGTSTGPTADFPYYYSDTMSRASNDNTVMAAYLDGTVPIGERAHAFAGYRYSREKLDYTFTRYTWNNVPVQMGTNFTTLLPAETSVAPAILQFSHDNTDSGWSARAGLRWKAAEKVNLYAIVSRGYVGAGVDLSNGTRGTTANPELALLKPSTAVNYEIGAKSELLGGRLRLNLAAYRLKAEDVQVTALIPGTNINQVRNAGNIEGYGLEGSFDALIGERIEINGGFAVQRTEFQNLTQICYPGQTAAQGCVSGSQVIDGMPALNAPDAKFSLGATYNLPLPNAPCDLALRSQISWQDKVFFQLDHDPLAVQDPFEIVDLSLDFIDREGRYAISLFGANLTDQYYCPNMVSGPTARQSCHYTPAEAQRRFGVELKLNF